MGQKVHPTGFRLGISTDWRSRWFADKLYKDYIGEDVKEILDCDLKREKEAHQLNQEAIAYCESVRDFVSRELFVHIQKSEEGHIDWIETQLGLIERMGLENYVQSAVGEAADS